LRHWRVGLCYFFRRLCGADWQMNGTSHVLIRWGEIVYRSFGPSF
jgi:hypothetical protein